MQTKTINKVINNKIEDWLKSIEDKQLRLDLKSKIIVTGGCIASMIMTEEVNDYDIYLTDKDIVKRVSEYYSEKWNESNSDRQNGVGKSAKSWVLDGADVKAWKEGKIELSSFAYGYNDIQYSPDMEWNAEDSRRDPSGPSGMLLNTPEDRIKIMINSDGISEESDIIADNAEYDVNEYLDKVSDGDIVDIDDVAVEKEQHDRYRPVFLSSNAITLSNKIQIVIRFFGDAEEIHENYDFVHCTNYWEGSTQKCVMTVEAMEAVINKVLVYRGSKYPIASIIRTRKFLKRGYHINAGQYLKMALQVNKLNLNDIYVLEEQLVGVDSLYFLNFIHQIRKEIENGKQIDLTGDYVTKVIDKVFG